MKRILLPIGMIFAVLSCTAATEQFFDKKQALTLAGREYIESIFAREDRAELVYKLIAGTFMSGVTPASGIQLGNLIVAPNAVYTLNKDGDYSHRIKSGMEVQDAPLVATLLLYFFTSHESITLTKEWFNDAWQVLVEKSSYPFASSAAALQIGISNVACAGRGASPVTVTDSAGLAATEYIAQLHKAVQAMIECAWYIRTIAQDPEILALRKERKKRLAKAKGVLKVLKEWLQ